MLMKKMKLVRKIQLNILVLEDFSQVIIPINLEICEEREIHFANKRFDKLLSTRQSAAFGIFCVFSIFSKNGF